MKNIQSYQMMDDKVVVDDIDVIDRQQQQHQVYSVYEPHYQQMHPLIFYEDTSGHHHQHQQHQHQHQQHHQLHHHHLHHSGLAAIAHHHHWDHEHFGVRETCEIHNSNNNSIEKRAEDIKREDINNIGDINSITINHSDIDNDNDCNTNHNQLEQTVSSDETEGNQTESQTPTNRELHNEIERRRRLRIKQCCDILRTLVPGLSEKTDKATVLEHTVKFVSHLSKCPAFKCKCTV